MVVGAAVLTTCEVEGLGSCGTVEDDEPLVVTSDFLSDESMGPVGAELSTRGGGDSSSESRISGTRSVIGIVDVETPILLATVFLELAEVAF